jgi:hypothetical protein
MPVESPVVYRAGVAESKRSKSRSLGPIEMIEKHRPETHGTLNSQAGTQLRQSRVFDTLSEFTLNGRDHNTTDQKVPK